MTNSVELEINEDLQNNPNFQELITETEDFYCLLHVKLIENANINEDLGFATIEEVEIESVLSYLEISEEYDSYLSAFSSFSAEIRSSLGQELEVLTQEEIAYNFEAALEDNISLCDDGNETQDVCDDQFQIDMKNIHDSYDAAVSSCTAVILSGKSINIACYGVAFSKMTLETGLAIDRHTCCKQNQSDSCAG
ncbi:hypothetical protein [Mesonia maritima]|uniref:Uncharacterized protein n=1 Tax=Mesonia maritima TaxID=1793873 RepID=A0ABU1K2N5_9FLAO|nr:hypothetical protein [Mesonia maritima]MDR6299870.1 hypothetical protein [Mesonia maritima]